MEIVNKQIQALHTPVRQAHFKELTSKTNLTNDLQKLIWNREDIRTSANEDTQSDQAQLRIFFFQVQ